AAPASNNYPAARSPDEGDLMARVRLYYDQTNREELPELCMACGQPATRHIPTTLSWFPPWVYVLLPAGLLFFAIIAMVLTKRMRIEAPVCDRHQGYWWKKTLLMLLPFLATIPAAIVFGLIADQIQPNSAGIACIAFTVLFVAWLIFAIVVRLK